MPEQGSVGQEKWRKKDETEKPKLAAALKSWLR